MKMPEGYQPNDKPGSLGFGEGQEQPVTSAGDLDAHVSVPDFNPLTDLFDLRHKFPFLPIMPVPNSVSTVVLDGANAQDLPIADGATVAMFLGSGDFYLSLGGNAVVPTSINVAKAFSLYKPDRFLFYVRGKQNVSVISPTNGVTVQAWCYITDNWSMRKRREDRD